MQNLPNQYIPFARKYRPNNFSELEGQEVLVKILSHTIISNRMAQGYLLTGIRGVGKTTSARIIAKTVNCTDIIVKDNDIKTCEKCANCASFNNHNHPDIIEIDAASKTSVDDIRRIIEISEYRPLIGKYKVFIIDEVHMLSKGAFNALLKILEEPPNHVIFIFATTEVQKIPLTVISRCQRYDLRRLTFEEILELLKYIAAKETLPYGLEALKIIASKSEGSARDAVSMLDQAASLTTQKENNIINTALVNQMLGLSDTACVIEFVEAILNKDVNHSIELINKLYLSSANLAIFIELVADFIAYLSKVKMLPNYTLPTYELFAQQIKNILNKIEFSNLSILWQMYSKAIAELKASHNQLIEVEMLVMKSVYFQSLPTPEELVNIENNVATCTSKQKIYKIDDFLKYLHQNHEMDVYYILLNQAEIKIFADNILEIAGNNINIKMKEQITNLLNAWSGNKFNVSIEHKLEITTFKDQLINKVKSEKDWDLLKKHFPNVEISDILLTKN